jgi:exodeoxyribonuclease VII large subunit
VHDTYPVNQNKIYTVSSLTAEIKTILENQFPFIWIAGEISNFRIPASGHFYFILKDENAQINAVMFRGQNQNLKFKPEDGMMITGLGRINVYESRGTYQIILEYLEPKGTGALQIAFEQLKAKLSKEGLFDDAPKKPIPYLPKKIGVITSLTGAVIHDIQRVLFRRFPNVSLVIYPVRVQGEGADEEIVKGFELLNRKNDIHVIILARGGGSLEDLHAFNSEIVARAIFKSTIPTISAVGHETDYTISDFVADLRASTPSVAAELAVPVKDEVFAKCEGLFLQLKSHIFRNIDTLRNILHHMDSRLIDPKKRIQDLQLKTDDLFARMHRAVFATINRNQERIDWRTHRLLAYSPMKLIINNKATLKQLHGNLLLYKLKYLDAKRYTLENLNGKLNTLNPNAILERGYSITQSMPGNEIVKDSISVETGQNVHVRFSKGSIICRVERKN